MKFKIGDTVIVRSDLIGGKSYGGLYFADGMERFRGQSCKIVDISLGRETYYLEDEEYWEFNDSMLEYASINLSSVISLECNRPLISTIENKRMTRDFATKLQTKIEKIIAEKFECSPDDVCIMLSLSNRIKIEIKDIVVSMIFWFNRESFELELIQSCDQVYINKLESNRDILQNILKEYKDDVDMLLYSYDNIKNLEESTNLRLQS